ncbi:MAG: methylated-DNA--[protein]-cysteine S-methyltransferase, partial [Clostridia bacterium]|nr:methylated-DNA--[protein]-cysteine S-methyltransferase [Clostridia bacterium]
VFLETRRWLDLYFEGREPDFLPPVSLSGSPFQQAVWAILKEIPYGQTVTYGDIALRLRSAGRKASAQAVGGAFLLSAAAALSETAGHGFIACNFA